MIKSYRIFFSKQWHTQFFKDPYVKKSWKEDYRSRASFKLLEMNEKYKFLDNYKLNVLELGCYPGGWSQVLQKKLQRYSKVLAIDLQQTPKLPEIKRAPEINFYEGDIFSKQTMIKIKEFFKDQSVDLILSDISPDIAGHDSAKIIFTNFRIMELAERFLKKGGKLLIKGFQNTRQFDVKDFLQLQFNDVKLLKPEASRKESAEIYYYCYGYKHCYYWRLLQKEGDVLSWEELRFKLAENTNIELNSMHKQIFIQYLKNRAQLDNLKEDQLKFNFQKELFKLAKLDKTPSAIPLEHSDPFKLKNEAKNLLDIFPKSKTLQEISQTPVSEEELYEQGKEIARLREQKINQIKLEKINQRQIVLLDLEDDLKLKKNEEQLDDDPFEYLQEQQKENVNLENMITKLNKRVSKEKQRVIEFQKEQLQLQYANVLAKEKELKERYQEKEKYKDYFQKIEELDGRQDLQNNVIDLMNLEMEYQEKIKKLQREIEDLSNQLDTTLDQEQKFAMDVDMMMKEKVEERILQREEKFKDKKVHERDEKIKSKQKYSYNFFPKLIKTHAEEQTVSSLQIGKFQKIFQIFWFCFFGFQILPLKNSPHISS